MEKRSMNAKENVVSKLESGGHMKHKDQSRNWEKAHFEAIRILHPIEHNARKDSERSFTYKNSPWT